MKYFLLGNLFFIFACLEVSDEKDGTDSNTDSSTDTDDYTDTGDYYDTGDYTDYTYNIDCEFSLVLADEAGDGWNGAQIDYEVYDANGDEMYNVTYLYLLESHGSQHPFNFGVADGGTVYWTFTSGEYDEEISYAILDNAGDLVFGDGYPNAVVSEGDFQERTNCQ